MTPRRGLTGLQPRNRPHRDIWVCLVVVEGSKTERLYLEALREQPWVDTTRVRLEVTPSEDKSSPALLYDRLTLRAQELGLTPLDSCWLLNDLDHNTQPAHIANFNQVVRAIKQRPNHHHAVSNPCFEVWLLLHFTQELGNLITSQDAKKTFHDALARRRLNNLPAQWITREGVEDAVARARALDTHPAEPWPQSHGSRVYLLIEALPRRR